MLSNLASLCSVCHGLAHGVDFSADHAALTREGLQRAKARGVQLGGRRPGQERAAEASRQKAQDAAERLRGVLEPLVVGGASLRQIGAALEAAGIRSNQGGQSWSPTMVKRAIERLGVAR